MQSSLVIRSYATWLLLLLLLLLQVRLVLEPPLLRRLILLGVCLSIEQPQLLSCCSAVADCELSGCYHVNAVPLAAVTVRITTATRTMNSSIVGIVTDTGMSAVGVFIISRRVTKSITTSLVGAREADQNAQRCIPKPRRLMLMLLSVLLMVMPLLMLLLL